MSATRTDRERPLLGSVDHGQHKGNDNKNNSGENSKKGFANYLAIAEEGRDARTAGRPSDNPPTTLNAPAYQHVKESKGGGSNDIFKTIATMSGNILEWYDFAIFGYFSDVIGEVFFPPDQAGNAALIESFLVFGSAFLVRPIGALILGHIGDVYGRKKALELSIFLMAIPTFIIGCLPSFSRAGHWAIAGLAIVRMVQGLSVAGQMMSSLVFTCEQHPRSTWGFYGTHTFVGAHIGSFLGNTVGFVMRKVMSESDLVSWGWRIPFCSGLLVGLSGLYLHYFCEDDPIPQSSSTGEKDNDEPATGPPPQRHEEANDSPRRLPLFIAFEKRNLRSLFAAILVTMLWSACFYLCFIWMAIYMTKLVDPPVPNGFAVNAVNQLLTMVLFELYAGTLSDMFGRVRTMTVGGVAAAILAYPMLRVIDMGNPWTAGVAQCSLGVALALWAGPMGAWLVESFEPEARLTSVSIGYNISQSVFGGFSPALATYLVDRVGTASPGVYISVVCVLGVIGLRCVAPPPPVSSSFAVDGNAEDAITKDGSSAAPPLLPSDPSSVDDVVDDPDNLLRAKGEFS